MRRQLTFVQVFIMGVNFNDGKLVKVRSYRRKRWAQSL